MTSVHSPWPLFSDDIDFAQSWMRDQLSRLPITGEAGHIALSIGLRYEVERHLACQSQDGSDEQSTEDQFRFRLARMDGVKNPYKELIPNCHHVNVCRFVAEAAHRKMPLAVRLFGGVGDQLEMLSLVVPWSFRHGVPLQLFAEEKDCRLFGPLLPDHASIKPFNPETCSPFAQSMAVRLGVFEHDPTSIFTAWIQAETQNPDPKQIVCCWRAKGQGSSLSAHSRSVPFPLVYGFYQRIMERKPQTKIFDITAWQPWEMKRFEQLGVTLKNPAYLGLSGLVDLCQGRRVVSIDTALIHLCTAMGHAADLLLPRFPDERWVELSKSEHNYGKNLTFHRSTQFGSWTSVMASLY